MEQHIAQVIGIGSSLAFYLFCGFQCFLILDSRLLVEVQFLLERGTLGLHIWNEYLNIL